MMFLKRRCAFFYYANKEQKNLSIIGHRSNEKSILSCSLNFLMTFKDFFELHYDYPFLLNIIKKYYNYKIYLGKAKKITNLENFLNYNNENFVIELIMVHFLETLQRYFIYYSLIQLSE